MYKRQALVGFGAVYALGYVGYMLMPAIGPLEEMGARSGGWLTETGGAFISQRTNGVDVFPSIHMAASLFLLMFDFQHRRAHFWWVLAPTVGLWISGSEKLACSNMVLELDPTSRIFVVAKNHCLEAVSLPV